MAAVLASRWALSRRCSASAAARYFAAYLSSSLSSIARWRSSFSCGGFTSDVHLKPLLSSNRLLPGSGYLVVRHVHDVENLVPTADCEAIALQQQRG
jgi:hypothetical protein